MTNPLPRLAPVEDPPWRAMIVPTAGTSALATPTVLLVGTFTGVMSTAMWTVELVSLNRVAPYATPPPTTRPMTSSAAPRTPSLGPGGDEPGCGGGAGTANESP